MRDQAYRLIINKIIAQLQRRVYYFYWHKKNVLVIAAVSAR